MTRASNNQGCRTQTPWRLPDLDAKCQITNKLPCSTTITPVEQHSSPRAVFVEARAPGTEAFLGPPPAIRPPPPPPSSNFKLFPARSKVEQLHIYNLQFVIFNFVFKIYDESWQNKTLQLFFRNQFLLKQSFRSEGV